MTQHERRVLTWALVLLDAVIALVFVASVTASELDLPVLPPDDPRRAEYVPAQLPEVPSGKATPALPPGPLFFGQEIPSEAAAVVYVLDYSGSMGWPWNGSTRWARVLEETQRSIRSLPASWRFGLVVFGTGACTARAWRDHTTKATRSAKDEATAWLQSNYADASVDGGRTPTASGMALALGMEGRHAVVLLTDGAPSPSCGGGNDWTRAAVRRINTKWLQIDCYGLGVDAGARLLLQGIASDSGGLYAELR